MEPWTITYGGKSWTDEDVRVAHAVAVADLIGDTWDAVSPWSGPRALAAWVAVLIATDSGDLPSSVAAVYQMSVGQLTGCLGDRTPAVAAVPTPAAA